MTHEPPLVGRDGELELFAAALDDVAGATHGLTIELAGEPGIGKSRLLRELCAQARERGHLLFEGRAAEFEAELPFGLFRDAFDDWLLAHEPERRAALAGDLAADLARVFPAFDTLGEHGPELHEERYRAYAAVRRLLSGLAGEAPVIVALDDVQWADPGSVELLSHLLAHPARGPFLLAVAFRPTGLPRRLEGALDASIRGRASRRLDVKPLSDAATRKLLGEAVPRALRESLQRESGGNPFYLLQLARGAAVAKHRRVVPGGAAPVPRGVRAALASELASLSAPARVLLQGAAVTGDPFDRVLAATAAEVGEPDALELIDELLAFGLVETTDAPGQFAFRHPIVRATVYESSKVSWRTRAHGRLALLLAERRAGAAARAPHVERSARVGDADAVAVLVAAGDASARRAPALAARWYAVALHLLPEGDDGDQQRLELLLARATALSGSGQLANSREALLEMLDRLPEGEPARVPVVATCAGVEHLLGRHRDADARLASAHTALGESRSIEAARLALELAAGSGFQNRDGEMMAWAERALAAVAPLNGPAVEVAARGQIALASYFAGLPAGEALDRAANGLDALADGQLATRLDIGLWVGWTEAVLERHGRSIEHCQRVIDVSRSTGQGATLLVTMTAQAWALLRAGRLAEAEATLADAIEAGQLAPGLFLSVAVGLSAVVATYRGEYEQAVRAGEECVRLACSADPGLIPGMAGLYLATPLIEIGEPERAREVVLEMSGGTGELQTSRSGHAAAFEVLTRAELALGRPDAAEAWARKAEVATHGGHLAAEAAFAARAAATVALARREPERAAETALHAASRAAAAGVPAEAGRCRIVGGRALALAGRRDQATATLDQAVAELAGIGAHGYVARAEDELRTQGRRVARRARARHPRPRVAHRARAGDRRPRPPRTHQPQDRCRRVSEREDGRAPPLAHLRQARDPRTDRARGPHRGRGARVRMREFPQPIGCLIGPWGAKTGDSGYARLMGRRA